ncbi:MAG: PAS domain S-box protein [Candidatus Goldbacteria bacterium]|nr:PAS domain S-box protein [Candidatus Goldiibacteriota bacterium]
MQTFFIMQILHLSSLFIYVHLIIFLITNYPLDSKNKLTIVLFSLTALWSFCKIFLHNPATSFEMANFFDKFMSINWILVPPVFLLFSLSLSDKPPSINKWILRIIIFLPAIIFIILNFLGYLTEPIKYFDLYWFSNFKKNTIVNLYYFYFILYTIGSILHFFILKNKTKIKNKKKQLDIFISVSIFTLLLMVGGEVIIPNLNLEHHPIQDIGNIYFLIFAFGIFYALLKYQFLGLSPIKTFNTIISNLSEFLFILDEEFNFSFINKSALNNLKYSAEELINKPFVIIVESDFDFNKILKDLIIKKIVSGYDLSLKTKDGKIIPVSLSAKAIEEQGEIIRIICVAMDISERIKLTEYLKEQRELAEKYLNIAPIIFLILNREGKIMFLNDAGMKILGVYSESEYSGKIWFEEFIPEDEKDLTKSYFFKFINEKTILNELENYVITKKGEKKLIHWSNTLLTDKENKIYGVLSAGIDITETKEAEKVLEENYEKLKELNKLKDNFISVISHELRTPLTAIIGFISLMLGGATGKINKNQQESLEIMKNNSERLLSLINDLLDVSKIESGKLKISLSEIDLVFLIKSTITEIKSLLDKKQIICNFNSEVEEFLINADKQRLTQAIVNILNNAIKFSPSNSKIIIELKKIDKKYENIPSEIKEKINSNNHFALISITDYGIGMTDTQIKNLFQKFYQAEDANIRKTPGTGLGLYITKNLIELHNGFIWAESKGINTGSTFNILLPI